MVTCFSLGTGAALVVVLGLSLMGLGKLETMGA
jgi:hypothetical protein